MLTDTECANLILVRISFRCSSSRVRNILTEQTNYNIPIFFNRFQSSSLNTIPSFLNIHLFVIAFSKVSPSSSLAK